MHRGVAVSATPRRHRTVEDASMRRKRWRLGSLTSDPGAATAPTAVLDEMSARWARGRRRRPGSSPPLLSGPAAPPGGRGSELPCRWGMGMKAIAGVPLFF
jgi:hypothetical protein